MTLTPEQFNLLATKEDLKQFVTKADFKEDINKVVTAIDGLAKKVDNFQQELASNQGAHDRIQKQVDGHEARIGKLEASIA